MLVVFSPEAREEFAEAERYYNQQASQLGGEFRKEIRETLPRLQQWPLACPVERGELDG